jgi:hypothetical protein
LRALWEQDEGAVRDIVIRDATVQEWQRVVTAIRRAGWAVDYREDAEPAPMPDDVRAVFAATGSRACRWRIQVGQRLWINCHFFDPAEIEFTFDPREVTNQQEMDSLCVFMRTVGRAVEKPVRVYVEGFDPRPPSDMEYDPDEDAVRASPA